MKKICLVITLALALLLSGCGAGGSVTPSGTPSGTGSSNSTPSPSTSAAPSSGSSMPADVSELFSDRDFEIGYDEDASALIQLNGSSATCTSDAVQIDGSTITITDEGTYILTGTLDDGMVIVNSEKNDKTQLVLDNASIHSETSAPIYILQSDKVFITLASGSENSLSNGGSFTAIDENNIDAVIFSKEDLTLNGSGSLSITSPAGHGIVSKDELTLTSGTYNIGCASHALSAKDNICIANIVAEITSGKDGIHAENNDDASLGYVYIQSGTFTISAEGDGISAAAQLQIDNGTFDIISGGGSENAQNQTSDSWGDFMGGGMGGGMMGGGGRPGGMGRSTSSASATSTTADDDSTSIKGIKSSGDMVINGGTFTIDSADDSVHSNTNITVNNGSFRIASGDDAFHADDTLTVNGGTIDISESYEGLEGLHVLVAGGDISLYASDDGLNAAGGTDQSGTGGFRGDDQFGMGGMMGGMSSGNGSIVISGGSLYINASGDGIDANGTLTISGGYTVVCGPTMGDTATLDYDASAVITGGTFIGTGASGMAQTFSGAEQGLLSLSAGNQSAGTEIVVKDSAGNTVLTHTPDLNFAVVILSSPDIISGETYTITIGTASGSIQAD